MKSYVSQYSEDIIAKAKQVKALLFDVDGVLTDGKIIYKGGESEIKEFHVRDGQIIKPLLEANIIVGIITGRVSEAVNKRAKELAFDIVRQGIKDKVSCLEEVKLKFDLRSEDIAYIGDDYPDLPLIKDCILGVCPADAPSYIKEDADLVTSKKGGEGVVREVADLILMAQNKFPAFL